jgi:hypothetical protein
MSASNILKRKFSNRIGQHTRSFDDDGIFDFELSQPSSESSYYSHTSDEMALSSNCEIKKRIIEFPCLNQAFSNCEESAKSEIGVHELSRCYICSNNNMVLPNGAVRDWVREPGTELLKQHG